MSIYSKKFNKDIFEDHNSSVYKILNLINQRPKTILDVGCSSGYFGAFLKERFNCNVWGIEIDKKDYQLATKQLDKVFNINIENKNQLSKIKTKFDIIIFADVLEHLKDPLSCLKNFKNKLASNGDIIASIPNIGNYYTKLMLFNGEWKYEDIGLMDKTHKTFFTYENIIKIFEEAGFYIYKIDYTRSNISTPNLINMLKKSGVQINQTIINNFFSIESDIFQYIIRAKSVKPEKYTNYLKNKTINKLFASPKNIKKIESETISRLIKENKAIKKELDKIKSSKTFIYWQKFNQIKRKVLNIKENE